MLVKISCRIPGIVAVMAKDLSSWSHDPGEFRQVGADHIAVEVNHSIETIDKRYRRPTQAAQVNTIGPMTMYPRIAAKPATTILHIASIDVHNM